MRHSHSQDAPSTARPHVECLERDAVLELAPQNDSWAERARHHAVAMVSRGTRHYVGNVDADVALLRVDERLLPVVVKRHGGPRNRLHPAAAVVCPRSHYAGYTQEEFARRHPKVPDWLRALAFAPLNAIIALGELDKVVVVNNWLLTTNPQTRYSCAELSAVTACLSQRYPSSAIVFRGWIPGMDGQQLRLFQRAGFQIVRYRRVWIVEDCGLARNGSPEIRRDLRLLERTGYEIVDDPAIISAQAERLAALYRDLYLGKYSRLNLHFNAEFVRLTLREGLLAYRAFRKNGSLDAFKAWFIKDGMMTGAFVGYDRRKPRTLGLYRQAMALQLSEAARLGLKLHLSGGAGKFKALRGATPQLEYEAVWDRHLAPRRRLPWALLASAGRIAAGVDRAR